MFDWMKVCILDGWGENENKDEWNAIHVADTPTTDGLRKLSNRWRTVQAHGKAVGLPSDAGQLLDCSSLACKKLKLSISSQGLKSFILE